MRILVTGSQGQLARCLADVARTDAGIEMNFAGRPDFDLSKGVAAEQYVIQKDPDVIVNAAAYTAVDKAESEPGEAMSVNCDGAAAMARAAAELDVPIIHISTDYVFSGDKNSPYVEEDATGPVGAYGASKLAGEDSVRSIAGKHLILRTAWVYSIYGTNFVKTMLRVGKDRPELRVVGDQIGNPTSAHDLAAATLALCKRAAGGQGDWGTYHAAGQGDVTWFGYAQRIFETAGKAGYAVPAVVPIGTKDYPTPAKRPANSRLDCSKLREVFGVQLPMWQGSTDWCVKQLLTETRRDG